MVGRVYRGEIYYIHETEGTGSEQTGGRPGIIISNGRKIILRSISQKWQMILKWICKSSAMLV